MTSFANQSKNSTTVTKINRSTDQPFHNTVLSGDELYDEASISYDQPIMYDGSPISWTLTTKH